MRLRFATGHNNPSGLSDFPYEARVTQDLDFNVEYTANGIAKKIGGGAMRVEWDYLEYSELIVLMDFFGISHRAPSAAGTFVLPDWYQVPTIMNGQITLQVPKRADGVYRNVVADLTGLDYA